MKTIATLAFLLSLLILPSHASERPNVLMIVVDDMNDWVGCLGGHPLVKTPNIDRLAKRGTLFTNAHCAAPVCNASRVATLTGLRPSTTGIYDNSVKWQDHLSSTTSLPQHFKRNGYTVLGGGKVFHHMPGFNRLSDWDEYLPQQFDGHFQQSLHGGKDVTTFQFPQGYPLNGIPQVKALTRPPRNAREFDWGELNKGVYETGDGKLTGWAKTQLQRTQKQPFLLVVGIYRPHLPFYAPERFFEHYPRDAISIPTVLPGDIADLPAAGKQFASQRREDLDLVQEAGKFRSMIRAYLASITFADFLIGNLLDELEASKYADNTIIVLWSDHGWHFGEKQHLHKMTLWERATRIPFVISLPKRSLPRGQCNAPVSLIDLFPTLIDLCGLPNLDKLDGTSLRPQLEDPTTPRARPAIITHGYNNHAIRTERWRYIRYWDGGEELYDHRTDPHEWHNLAASPDKELVKHSLYQLIPKTNTKSLSKKRIP